MKPTLTINLAGRVYHIDEDAYERLKAYLTRVEQVLLEDKEEVMRDIEARVAELFTDYFTQEQVSVVSLKMVDDVIERLGNAEQIGGMGETIEADHSPAQETCSRKLYLDVDRMCVGGVCAGLAQYTGMDVALIRILFVLCTLLWGTSMIIYCLLWIIVPSATTAAQRLEMRGIAPTAENIRREVSETANMQPRNNNGCLSMLFKLALAMFVLVVIVPTLLSVIFVLFVLTAVVSVLPMSATLLGTGMHGMAIGMAICLILFIALPLVALIYWLCVRYRPTEKRRRWPWIVLLLLWLVSVVGVGSSGLLLHQAFANTLNGMDMGQAAEVLHEMMEKGNIHVDEATLMEWISGLTDPDKADSIRQIISEQYDLPDSIDFDVMHDIDTSDPMGDEVMVLEE